MSSSLALILLLLAALPEGRERPSEALTAIPAAPARIRVEAGRAQVLAAGRLRQVAAGQGELELAGPIQVEVPPLARVSVRWPGRSSVQISGPAGLVWRPGREGQADRWMLLGRGGFELEVRSGPVLAELAPGWTGRLESGAWRIEGLPGGEAFQLLHRAGAPLEIRWRGSGGRLLPPLVVRPGEELRLGAVLLPANDLERGARAPAWSTARPLTWPFGTGLEPAHQARRMPRTTSSKGARVVQQP